MNAPIVIESFPSGEISIAAGTTVLAPNLGSAISLDIGDGAHLIAPALASVGKAHLHKGSTLGAPTLRSAGSLRVARECTLATPALEAVEDLKLYKGARCPIPALKSASFIWLEEGSRLATAALEKCDTLLLREGACIEAQALRNAKSAIMVSPRTTLILPALESGKDISIERSGVFSAENLRTVSGALRTADGALITVPSLRDVGPIALGKRVSVDLPSLRTVNGNIEVGEDSCFTAPNLRAIEIPATPQDHPDSAGPSGSHTFDSGMQESEGPNPEPTPALVVGRNGVFTANALQSIGLVRLDQGAKFTANAIRAAGPFRLDPSAALQIPANATRIQDSQTKSPEPAHTTRATESARRSPKTTNFILPVPTEEQRHDPAYIQAGKLPEADVITAAIQNPALFEEWVAKGLPLSSRYPDALLQVIEARPPSHSFLTTLRVFNRAGIRPSWKHLAEGKYTLCASDFLHLVQHSTVAQGDAGAVRLATLVHGKDALRTAIATSGILGASTEAFNKAHSDERSIERSERAVPATETSQTPADRPPATAGSRGLDNTARFPNPHEPSAERIAV